MFVVKKIKSETNWNNPASRTWGGKVYANQTRCIGEFFVLVLRVLGAMDCVFLISSLEVPPLMENTFCVVPGVVRNQLIQPSVEVKTPSGNNVDDFLLPL